MDSNTNAPISPAQFRRWEATVKAHKQAEKLLESQQNLLKDELERQEAEQQLDRLTQRVSADLEDVTHQLQGMNMGVGTILKLSEDVEPVYPGSRYPAYVIYQGKGGTHGVFYAWKSHNGVSGAREFYDNSCHNHVVRSFSNRALAHEFYKEFVNAGIPELLAEADPDEHEHFIVVEGVKPMACRNWKALIMDGLQFRGGVAYRFMGDMGSAWGKFNQLKAQGLVKVTHPSRTLF
ncbi:hypothetical protein GGU10DRAFT_379934 [Lentinula aff. detonsa]|uniref:Uncharacterized protein n=1 Tax=Lentinula aff. detonsa TaxID=2804958 RepID=A0AA38KNQ9_9AGAR|nr:hypothetical protein GGU10DRAFT_379934 [Lentinula aff. detonsa]